MNKKNSKVESSSHNSTIGVHTFLQVLKKQESVHVKKHLAKTLRKRGELKISEFFHLLIRPEKQIGFQILCDIGSYCIKYGLRTP